MTMGVPLITNCQTTATLILIEQQHTQQEQTIKGGKCDRRLTEHSPLKPHKKKKGSAKNGRDEERERRHSKG